MALRDFSDVSYLPLLGLRPSEMDAVEQLASKSKDSLLPYFFLGPWVGSHTLDRSTERIQKAYPDRPYLLELPVTGVVEKPREVHDQLDQLRLPADGYANWAAFIGENTNAIPVVQLADLDQLDEQLYRLASLERGIAVRLPEEAFGVAQGIATRIGGYFSSSDVLIVLDHARQTRELLVRQAVGVSLSSNIADSLPGCRVAWSASSFPSSFVGISAQDIYERQFFNGVQDQLPDIPLLYSDRGSAKAEKQNGGGGTPAPRVDFAQSSGWSFFREEDNGDRQAAYRDAALNAMDAECWDDDLKVWGTQMIERTSQGDEYAIKSPATSTAARINIHLHQQLCYNDPDALYATEEEWSD